MYSMFRCWKHSILRYNSSAPPIPTHAGNCGSVSDSFSPHERDLCLAPQFFRALSGSNRRSLMYRFCPSPGHSLNQLTAFRYDAILRVNGAAEPGQEFGWLDWHRSKLTASGVSTLLSGAPETLAIRNIPNARLDADVATVSWLKETGASDSVESLRGTLAREHWGGIEPEVLCSLNPAYRVELSQLNSRNDGAINAALFGRICLFAPSCSRPPAERQRAGVTNSPIIRNAPESTAS